MEHLNGHITGAIYFVKHAVRFVKLWTYSFILWSISKLPYNYFIQIV